ncbi:hypothetical protein CsatB_022624 [Cannabis sativa]
MVNTRSSLSPSGSSKLLLDKLKMKKTISEDDNEDLSGGSEGSGDVSVKEVKMKQYNRGNKKVTDDRPLKKLKQVVEYDEDFYDSDDLEVENNESMKESGLKDGVNVDLAVKDDLVMKEVDDVDLVPENVKDYSIDPVLNLAESGGVLVNEGDTVVEVLFMFPL